MITKLELIEYLKHTPENTNYNILYSSLYNGSNKEAVDEFIEVLSRGNLSLAALQPYLAKLYEDDKTISPDPLPPLFIGGSPDAVLYTPQTLTEAQKKQARDNIDAAGEFVINATLTSDKQSATLDKTFAQIQESINAGKTPIVLLSNVAYLILSNIEIDYIEFSNTVVNNRTASFVALDVYPDKEPQFSVLDTVILTPNYNLPQVIMDSDPTEPMEIATKKYVDEHAGGGGGGGSAGAVRYDVIQSLTVKDKQRALDNINAAFREWPTFTGSVSLCPEEITDSDDAVHVTTEKASSDDFTVTLDCGLNNAPVRVKGIKTPTDADTNAAATVEYVNAKVASGAEVYYIDLAGTYPSYTCATAMEDIAAAYASGKELKCRFAMGMYTAVLPLFMPKPGANTWIFSGSGALAAMGFPAQSLTIAIVNGTVQASDTRLASMDDIPTIPDVLPNPNALTIKIGSTTVTYDGSAAKTVEIADGSEVSY